MRMVVLLLIFCAGIIKPAAVATASPLRAAFTVWLEKEISDQKYVFSTTNQRSVFTALAYVQIYDKWLEKYWGCGEKLSQEDASKLVKKFYQQAFCQQALARQYKPLAPLRPERLRCADKGPSNRRSRYEHCRY